MINELNILFQNLTLAMIGADGQYGKVRIGWPTQGQPAWKIDEDVAFLLVSETDDPYNRQRETDAVEHDAQTVLLRTKYTRIINVRWVFYGPGSNEAAQTVRDSIYFDVFRDVLAASQLFLIPDIPAPRRIPEAFQGRWWERADLSMRFNQAVSLERTVHFIKSADITLVADTGAERLVRIEEAP